MTVNNTLHVKLKLKCSVVTFVIFDIKVIIRNDSTSR